VGEPCSWLLIRPGWKVLAADGAGVGEVDEVAGDSSKDIFDGIAFAPSALGRPRYARADQVAQITEGAVTLSLTRDQAEALDEYREPATSLAVEPESKGGAGETVSAEAREIEGDVLAPIRPERPPNILQRIAGWIRRRRG
jgi:hypothetical protein